MDMNQSDKNPYKTLGISLGVSYVVMTAVMFSRVNEKSNLYLSLNQIYMAGLMVAPMLIIMILLMKSMYQDKKLNSVLIASAILAFGTCWLLLRNQAGVGDQQFVRSMIPHHSAAILVCEQASLKDPRTVKLCEQIIAAQKDEIEQMKEIMRTPK